MRIVFVFVSGQYLLLLLLFGWKAAIHEFRQQAPNTLSIGTFKIDDCGAS
jgi:hypothetical protein